MTVDQVAVGMQVVYTGDSRNFGEDWTIPHDKTSIGVITKLSDNERWDVIVKWDKAVLDYVGSDDPAYMTYYYKAASLSPLCQEDF